MKPSAAAALAAAAVLSACDGSQPSRVATFDTLPGGIVRVVNPGSATLPDTGAWHAVLERTIRPPEGDPAALLQPGVLALRDDGAILVADGPPITVKYFAADGTFLGTIGRNGEGPGEYQSAYPMWLGDTIVVQDSRGAGSVLLFGGDGEFLDEFPGVCCVGGVSPGAGPDGTIRLTGAAPRDALNPGRFVTQWVLIRTNGARLDSIVVPVSGTAPSWDIPQPGGGVASYSIPFAPSNAAELFADGTIVAGFGDRYAFTLRNRNGDTLRVIERTGVEAAPVDMLTRQRTQASYAEQLPPTAGVNLDDIPDRRPFFTAFHRDGDGHILVQRPRDQAVGDLLDFFTAEGEFLGSMALPSTNGYPRLVVRGARLAIEDTDEADLPRIRVFRIDRSRP